MPKVLEDNHMLSDLRGQRQLHWIPIGMDLLTENDDGTPRGYSDFPWYGSHVLILRSDAANGLREIMRPYGEFLPLKGGDGLELFNATTVLDALDEDRSEIIRFDDGDVLTIERYVFRQEAIGNCLIFKLPTGRRTCICRPDLLTKSRTSNCVESGSISCGVTRLTRYARSFCRLATSP